MTPDRTVTYPVDLRGYQSGPDLITALGVVGTGITLPMLAAQTSFTLGRADRCDLQVSQKYLASVHARLDRVLVSSRANIRVSNVSSRKNDVVYNEVAEGEFLMGAGEWFEIGDSRYYALNEEMRLARPAVMEALGIRKFKAIDEFLIAAVKDSARHVLLLGKPGSDQERLGRAIHQASHRRHNRFHVMTEKPRLTSANRQQLRDAGNGTVLVDLHQKGKLDERVAAALVHPDAKLRLIICARSPDKVEASFPCGIVHDAKKITIPSLWERKNEIVELLNHWFITRRSSLRFSALREELREKLLAYTWPENLQELRETADILLQLAHCRSVRKATEDSLISRGTLRGWCKKLKLKLKDQLPLIPDKAD